MMDYGPDWPPPPAPARTPPKRRRRRRRRAGFSLGTNMMILLGTVVICAVVLKLTDRPMHLDPKLPKPAAGTERTTPHHR